MVSRAESRWCGPIQENWTTRLLRRSRGQEGARSQVQSRICFVTLSIPRPLALTRRLVPRYEDW